MYATLLLLKKWPAELGQPACQHLHTRGLGGAMRRVLFRWLLTTKLLTHTLQKNQKQTTKHRIRSTSNVWLLIQPLFPLHLFSQLSAEGYPLGHWGCTVYITNIHEWGINTWDSGNVSQPEVKSLKRIIILFWEMLFSS